MISNVNPVSTLRKGIGNPTSTNSKSTLLFDKVLSVSSVKCVLSILTPRSLVKSHLSVRSISGSSICSSLRLVIILTLSKLRILHIVDVDSIVWPIKIFFCRIILISVDFPALVSPGNCKHIQYWNDCILNTMHARRMAILKLALNKSNLTYD